MDTNSVTLPSNKRFGFFFCGVFSLFALYFYFYASSVYAIVFLFFSILFLLTAIFRDSLLSPLNKAWMQLGVLLGRIVSPIILALLFFLMFTPIALLMRLFNRDELHLRSSNSDTFWRLRDPVKFNKESFKQQF
tara:strand:- start:2025 stop:2426 length:402 start_codon:yes stop_codon:yes gene_type:complete